MDRGTLRPKTGRLARRPRRRAGPRRGGYAHGTVVVSLFASLGEEHLVSERYRRLLAAPPD